MWTKKRSISKVSIKRSINWRSKIPYSRLKDFFKSCLNDDGITDKKEIIKIREDIELITKQYKGCKYSDEEDNEDSVDEDLNFLEKYINSWKIKVEAVD